MSTDTLMTPNDVQMLALLVTFWVVVPVLGFCLSAWLTKPRPSSRPRPVSTPRSTRSLPLSTSLSTTRPMH